MIEGKNLEETILETKIPHILKYMGSKREILDFVLEGIRSLDVKDTWVCDLFAGTSVVSGSLKSEFNIHANDIQSYSAILSNTYLKDLKTSIKPSKISEIKNQVISLVDEFQFKFPNLNFDYSSVSDLKNVLSLEERQQNLINEDFDIGFHLFTKNYAGTYWSFSQCIWIDSIRAVAEQYKNEPEYYAIMSSLIFAMSYVSQSTGHYAQYRDVTESNLTDILLYRRRELWPLFERKFVELTLCLNGSATKRYKVTTLDYMDCLRIIEKKSIVYADPPYQSVHYSRFYHALETLVKYDYPKLFHKGRYRDDRHQSPFCKKTTVKSAFTSMFDAVKAKESHLVLSYSDTGMISLDEIQALSKATFSDKYNFNVIEKGHMHSNMGRSGEKEQNVTEYLVVFKKVI
jgi:adenine-specific DNA-methyltransferase